MEKVSLSDIQYLMAGVVAAVQEEIERLAERLIDKGKSMTPEGRKKVMEEKRGLVSRDEDFSKIVAKTVQRAFENAGLATQTDLDEIELRVDALEREVGLRKEARKKPSRARARGGSKKDTTSKEPSAPKESDMKAES